MEESQLEADPVAAGDTYAWLGQCDGEHFLVSFKDQKMVRVTLEYPTVSDNDLDIGTPVDIVDATIRHPFDQARPELLVARDLLILKSNTKKRRLYRLLAKASYSLDQRPPWKHGSSTSYMLFDGSTPSVCIVQLGKKIAIFKNGRDNATHIGFRWFGNFQSFPLPPHLDEAAQQHLDGNAMGIKGAKQILGYEPRYVLVAYKTPVQGYCRKVVVSLI